MSTQISHKASKQGPDHTLPPLSIDHTCFHRNQNRLRNDDRPNEPHPCMRTEHGLPLRIPDTNQTSRSGSATQLSQLGDRLASSAATSDAVETSGYQVISAHDQRLLHSIGGLHWHSGKVQLLARFRDSTLSEEEFHFLSIGRLPPHTFVQSAQECRDGFRVIWRPQWVGLGDITEDVVTTFFQRIAPRLEQIRFPMEDFWWRADVGEAIVDYTMSYHLCFMNGCALCRSTWHSS